ncbi:hypothetical protein SG9_0310 [Salmonella enterica subsp. enterica serovar Gallinarum str. SG9]|nr:hypothetical protein SG9_0310 [Salmonella enterica subsp. enterica serovar Gallinarum str. SG9]
MANKTERDIVFPMLLKKRNVGGGGSKYDVCPCGILCVIRYTLRLYFP